MEIISLSFYASKERHDFIAATERGNKPIFRKNKKTKPSDLAILTFQLFVYFGLVPDPAKIKEEIGVRPTDFLRFLGMRCGSKGDNLKNAIRNFNNIMKRKWPEIRKSLELYESFRKKLRISSVILRKQGKAKEFDFNGIKKYLKSDLAKINYGNVYKISDGNEDQILKCVYQNYGVPEYDIVRGLSHKNIMKAIDCKVDFGMDFCIYNDCGTSLDSYFRENPNYELKQIRRLVFNLFDALSYLERIRLVHGDLKPANMTINAAGELILIDFGGAFREGKEDLGIYTPDYCSPEYWAKRPRTTKYDVWAGAVTFYEILSGSLPWNDCGEENLGTLIGRTQLTLQIPEKNLCKALNAALIIDVNHRPKASTVISYLVN